VPSSQALPGFLITAHHLDRKKSPPPEGDSYFLCSLIKNPQEEGSPRSTWYKFRGESFSSRVWSRSIVKRKPNGARGFFWSICVCSWCQYNWRANLNCVAAKQQKKEKVSGDSRDTSTFVTSCPIGMSLPADSSCEGRVSLHFTQSGLSMPAAAGVVDEKGSEWILAHTGPRELDGHPLGGCGSGFGLVPGYTTLLVRVRTIT